MAMRLAEQLRLQDRLETWFRTHGRLWVPIDAGVTISGGDWRL